MGDHEDRADDSGAAVPRQLPVQTAVGVLHPRQDSDHGHRPGCHEHDRLDPEDLTEVGQVDPARGAIDVPQHRVEQDQSGADERAKRGRPTTTCRVSVVIAALLPL
jgi:hypothetical protein